MNGNLHSLARRLLIMIGAMLSLSSTPAHAQELRSGGKLILTNGISSLEGASGGGLTPWAVIGGNATRDGIGVQASATAVELKDYDFRSVSIAVGAFDKVELSYSRHKFDTNKVGGALGIGNDYAFDQDVYGLKVKLFGDAVYGPEMLPAVAIGAQYKKSLDAPIVAAVGAHNSEGMDYYVSATKLFLRHSVLVNATVRATRANQLGLLGFGGDKSNRYSVQFEGSAAYQLSRKFVVGAEYRGKPSKLSFAREDAWVDAFAAYAITRNVTVTAAYTDLGSIATKRKQRGGLIQLQASF